MSAELHGEESDEVDFVLTWRLDPDGMLKGSLDAANVGSRTLRLAGKPEVVPLGVDGAQLDASCIVTLEGRRPGYVDLEPGERARAFVFWSGWAGPPSSGRFRTTWRVGRSVDVTANGPRQPARSGPTTNLGAGWWEKL
jgi:hypothetical protein